MIGGMHTILYSRNADAVRVFFRKVLEFPSVDAGHGWLIFAAPPAEIAIHPAKIRGRPELYLMCADIRTTVKRLKSKGVEFTERITHQRWGLLTRFRLPDGETLGLYEPSHPMAVRMSSPRRAVRGKRSAVKRKAAVRNIPAGS